MAILLTTHDMEEADELCDRLAIMHEGVVVSLAPPAQLKAALGPEATLDDVFIQAVGGSIAEGGDYRDIRRTRSTAHRLG
jgi:ABC-2 type transport system ATP-binding protein